MFEGFFSKLKKKDILKKIKDKVKKDGKNNRQENDDNRRK